MKHFDLIILGAGCSGLALAQQLALQQYTGSVLLLDKRSSYENDKTWCFWANESNPWYHHAKYKWHYGLFSDCQNQWVTHHYQDKHYCCLPSKHFYDRCLLDTAQQNITLHLNSTVTNVTEHQDYVAVDCDDEHYRASHVVDTRYLPQGQDALLYQRFFGQEVLLETPLEKADKPRLMANLSHSNEGLNFYYILPFSPHHVLIEPTGFHQFPTSPDAMRTLIPGICEQEGISIRSVLREESGILPMGLNQQKQASQRIIHAGIAGGALRASTGYGFLSIQRWATECASRLIRDGVVADIKLAPSLQTLMDSIFLEVIRREPKLAPSLLMTMTNCLHPDQFSRFMTEDITMKHWFTIIKHLPKLPFLRVLPSALAFHLNGKMPVS